MVIQAMWVTDSPLLQLPYFTNEMVEKFKSNKIEDIPDFLNMDNDLRMKLLEMPESKIQEISEVCNHYPSFSMKVEVGNPGDLSSGEEMKIKVSLARDDEEYSPLVSAPYYPKVALNK